MNLFFLDFDPKKCAEYHCDKHVVKMLLELVQLMYTAHHFHKSILPENKYKPIKNYKHPTCLWVCTSLENYKYTSLVAIELAYEYTKRYHKIHKCQEHAEWLLENVPSFESEVPEYAPETFFSDKLIPLAMPDDCKGYDTVQSYRKYYKVHKRHFVKWTNTPVPYWFSFSDISKYF